MHLHVMAVLKGSAVLIVHLMTMGHVHSSTYTHALTHAHTNNPQPKTRRAGGRAGGWAGARADKGSQKKLLRNLGSIQL